MIPFDFITQWRQQVPWVQDMQVEQDLIISRALVEMFGHREVASTLAFRGGTAFYKLYLTPPARYSEDIDLVQVATGPIGPVVDAVREVLDPWLGKPRRTIKVEINTREHFSVLGIDKRRLEIESRWFAGTAMISTYQLDELLGTKLRALYQRKKGRDLFDLWIAQRRSAVAATKP